MSFVICRINKSLGIPHKGTLLSAILRRSRSQQDPIHLWDCHRLCRQGRQLAPRSPWRTSAHSPFRRFVGSLNNSVWETPRPDSQSFNLWGKLHFLFSFTNSRCWEIIHTYTKCTYWKYQHISPWISNVSDQPESMLPSTSLCPLPFSQGWHECDTVPGSLPLTLRVPGLQVWHVWITTEHHYLRCASIYSFHPQNSP